MNNSSIIPVEIDLEKFYRVYLNFVKERLAIDQPTVIETSIEKNNAFCHKLINIAQKMTHMLVAFDGKINYGEHSC